MDVDCYLWVCLPTEPYLATLCWLKFNIYNIKHFNFTQYKTKQ